MNSRRRNSARSLKRMFFAGVIAATTGFATASMADTLKPPPGYFRAVEGKSGGDASCPSPPEPFTETLEFESKYEGSGKSRDEVNPEAEAAYKQKTRPVNDLEKGVVSRVDKYMRSGNPGELKCVVSWLSTWASAKGLLGEATNHTGRSVRKWALASLSSSYLRLKFSSSEPLKNYPQETKQIEAWFSAIADHVIVEWPPTDPTNKINNHYYWAAWAMMATAVVTDRHDLFDRAVAIFRLFEKQVDADGYLPNEMGRLSRAASYHDYAMSPLAMIAAFGKANGVDLAAENEHALSRLAKVSAAALQDSSAFRSKTGVDQDKSGLDPKTDGVWLEAYCWTAPCTSDEQTQLQAARPLASTRLGGNLTEIYAGEPASR